MGVKVPFSPCTCVGGGYQTYINVRKKKKKREKGWTEIFFLFIQLPGEGNLIILKYNAVCRKV